MTETDRIARAYQELAATAGGRWSLSNPGNRAIRDERHALFLSLLERGGFMPLGERHALEVGCGTGGELPWLIEIGAAASNLAGVDLLPERVAAARRAHPGIAFSAGNAEHLEFADASFDLALAITVFSSIHDTAMAHNVASEIVRVLKPGGGLLWYDLRYDSTNQNVKAVPSARVRELFPTLTGELRTLTLLPPLARRLGGATRVAYPVLTAPPFLRSHLGGLLRKRAAPASAV